jgi:hypothetical protein
VNHPTKAAMIGMNKYVPGRSRNLLIANCIHDNDDGDDDDDEGDGIDPVDNESMVGFNLCMEYDNDNRCSCCCCEEEKEEVEGTDDIPPKYRKCE